MIPEIVELDQVFLNKITVSKVVTVVTVLQIHSSVTCSRVRRSPRVTIRVDLFYSLQDSNSLGVTCIGKLVQYGYSTKVQPPPPRDINI